MGVTANHVITAFENAAEEAHEIVAMVRTARLDLAHALIDRDEDLDLATFQVTEEQAAESEAYVVDCKNAWPPAMPLPDGTITFAGYPEKFRESSYPRRTEFRAAASATIVSDVTPRQIVSVYDPARGDHRLVAAQEFPDVGANWSGCSGGPVLVHYEREGVHRWHAVGVIIEGPKAEEVQGELSGYDRFRFRRLDFITSDGTLKKAEGWLPPGRPRDVASMQNCR